jgi:hypothetical protein
MISQKVIFRVRLIEIDKHEIKFMGTGFEVGDTLDVWLNHYGRKIKTITKTSVPNKDS